MEGAGDRWQSVSEFSINQNNIIPLLEGSFVVFRHGVCVCVFVWHCDYVAAEWLNHNRIHPNVFFLFWGHNKILMSHSSPGVCAISTGHRHPTPNTNVQCHTYEWIRTRKKTAPKNSGRNYFRLSCMCTCCATPQRYSMYVSPARLLRVNRRPCFNHSSANFGGWQYTAYPRQRICTIHMHFWCSGLCNEMLYNV